MARVYLILCFLMPCMASTCQDKQQFKKVEFTSLTRGYQKRVSVSVDSLVSLENERGTTNLLAKRKLKEGEWESLMSSLKDIKAATIAELKSPTKDRAFDGAMHSTLTLHTLEGDLISHSFDNENPNEVLLPLLKAIQQLEGASTK